MPGKPVSKVLIVSAVLALSICAGAAVEPVRTGAAAFGDWKDDAPGVRRHITAADLPKPFATQSASRSARVVAAPLSLMMKTRNLAGAVWLALADIECTSLGLS